ncbi:Glutaredoxin [Roseateles sp. YR242]|uniref:glutaredoxin family protein n=1 Tax=Roseateles sp. YR242 TaxID=1855305 RepID=UPI0008C6EAA1|nr:glutaredoxin domain-containing protein [Roseateles sp. YR242]SEL57453.1 Glutaredoxin [Roseateles sp. YR242]
MMSQRCPKCQHVREPDTRAPEWQCPACGVAYAKAGGGAGGEGASAGYAAQKPAPAITAHPRSLSHSADASFWSTWLAKLLITAIVLMVWFSSRHWLDTRHARTHDPAHVADIEIYTTSFCETCHAAKAYMNRNHIAYTEYDVESDIDRRREFYARGGQGTPLIFVHGQIMHGFDAGQFEQLRRGRRS